MSQRQKRTGKKMTEADAQPRADMGAVGGVKGARRGDELEEEEDRATFNKNFVLLDPEPYSLKNYLRSLGQRVAVLEEREERLVAAERGFEGWFTAQRVQIPLYKIADIWSEEEEDDRTTSNRNLSILNRKMFSVTYYLRSLDERVTILQEKFERREAAARAAERVAARYTETRVWDFWIGVGLGLTIVRILQHKLS